MTANNAPELLMITAIIGGSLAAFASLTWQHLGLTRRDPTSSPPRFDDYMRPTETHLARTFALVVLCWFFFYLVWWIGLERGLIKTDPVVPFLMNLATNATSFFLLSFYVELSATGNRHRQAVFGLRSSRWAWFYIFACLTTYEALVTFVAVGAIGATTQNTIPFDLIYGFGQATALYLVTGRLDAIAISEHADAAAAGATRLPIAHRIGVFAGYLYASIQPLYPVLSEESNSPWLPRLLVYLALFLKLLMTVWVARMLTKRGTDDAPTILQFHAYEMQRYTDEEISSFERKFLSKHLPHVYSQRQRDRNVGFLGIDYAYLNDYKLAWLGLQGPHAAILVRDVYGGTDVVNKGLRPWDLLTAINGVPVGGYSSRFPNVLAELRSGDEVEITFLRKRHARSEAHHKSDYDERQLTVSLGKYDEIVRPRRLLRTKLGYSVLYNSRDSGVVVHRSGEEPTVQDTCTVIGLRSSTTDRYYETPDTKMLRLAIEQLVHGDAVALLGHRHGDARSSAISILAEVTACRESPERLDPSQDTPSKPPRRSVERLNRTARTRLVKLHPNRFAPSLLETNPPLRSKLRHVMFFDPRNSLLFQSFAIGHEKDLGRDTIVSLHDLEFWHAARTHDVLAFVGPNIAGSAWQEGPYRHGEFFQLSL